MSGTYPSSQVVCLCCKAAASGPSLMSLPGMHPPPTDELQARRTPRTSKQLTIDEPATKSLLYPKAAWEISTNPMWAPAAREGHSAVYSPSLNQLFLFGGYAAGQGHLSDCSVCKLELGKGAPSQVKWSRMRLGGGVSKRSHHGCALCPVLYPKGRASRGAGDCA